MTKYLSHAFNAVLCALLLILFMYGNMDLSW